MLFEVFDNVVNVALNVYLIVYDLNIKKYLDKVYNFVV